VAFRYLKGACKTDRDFLPRPVVTGQGAMVLKLQESRFRLDIRKKFFYEGGETLKCVAQKSCGCPIKVRLDGAGALSNLI